MKLRTKKRLDYIPFIGVLFSAIYLIYVWMSGEILLQARHIAGLIFLSIIVCLLFYRHKLGVIALGVLILTGLFGIISYSPSIETITVGKSLGGDNSVKFLYFQPIFLVWAVLHFAISGRYYTGILSKRYWKEINSDEPLRLS